MASTTHDSDKLRLGVNIDHVATIRNARGGRHPDPVRAALAAEEAGADGITAHLREDRRHITDDDMARIRAAISVPLNFEMAATDEMRRIALGVKPNACCLVPERRQEVTTEGGLAVAHEQRALAGFITDLRDAGIRISLFIDPEPREIEASASLGADIVELHTGPYCHAAVAGDPERVAHELRRLVDAARFAHEAGIEVHAGHGLGFETVGPVAAISQMRELNIGHFLIGEAVFVGLPAAIRSMREAMDTARHATKTAPLARTETAA
ncbi:MAG: pyridoxine 5'-phosphate synthase [Pseudomonadota bacterium]